MAIYLGFKGLGPGSSLSIALKEEESSEENLEIFRKIAQILIKPGITIDLGLGHGSSRIYNLGAFPIVEVSGEPIGADYEISTSFENIKRDFEVFLAGIDLGAR